jgi:toxin CcdB
VARFDLHRLPGGEGYLLDVRSPFSDFLETRVVVPLLPPGQLPKPIRDLHPVFDVDGGRYVLAAQLMGAIRRRDLGRAVGNLEAERDAITKALDILLTRF